MKKKIIIISTILIVILTGIILKLTIFKKDITQITLNDNLEFEYNQEVYLFDTLTITDGIIMDQNYLIDTDFLGEKQITINYKNSNGWKKKYTYNYKVKDTTPPIFSFNSNVYLGVGEDINNILKNFFAGDNCDREVSFTFEGDYDVNQIGNYDIKVIASDDSNNQTVKETTLHVYQKQQENGNSSYTPPKVKQGVPMSYFIQNYKTDKTSFGVDLSVYQNVEDFNLLKEDGVEFVMLRLGYGPTQEGNFNTDNHFEDFYTRAKEAGLKVGVYYFSYATTLDEVDLEVNYVDSMLKDKELDLWISYDWENWNVFKDCKMNFNDLNKMAKKFMDKLNQKGYKTMNYSSQYYLEKIWNLEEYDLWYAQYFDEATTKKKFNIWQITDKGNVNGIDGYVDIDIMYN